MDWLVRLLAVSWTVLGVAKLSSGNPGDAVEWVVQQEELAAGLGFALSAMEVLLALLLAISTGRRVRLLAALSGLLALALGTTTLLADLPTCWCAGRLAALDGFQHSVLVGGLAVLSGVVSRPSRVADTRDVRIDVLLCCLAAIGTSLLVCLGASGARVPIDKSHRVPGEQDVRAGITSAPISGGIRLEGVRRELPESAQSSIDQFGEGSTIAISVIGEATQSPLLGATVIVEVLARVPDHENVPIGRSDVVARVEAATVDDGVYVAKIPRELTNKSRATTCRVVAWSVGYCATSARVLVSPRVEAQVALRLMRGETLQGVVSVFGTGEPIEGALVRVFGEGGLDLLSRDAECFGGGYYQSGGFAETDSHGKFAVSGLREGTHRLSVTLKGSARPIASRLYVLPRTEVEVRVRPFARGRVVIRDAESKELVSHASVTWSYQSSGESGFPFQDPGVHLSGGGAVHALRELGWRVAVPTAVGADLIADVRALGYKERRGVRVSVSSFTEEVSETFVYLERLSPLISLKAKCTWGDGTPYSGILSVLVSSPKGPRQLVSVPFLNGEAATEIRAVRGGSVRVVGELAGPYGGPSVAQSATRVTSALEEEQMLVIRLRGALAPVDVRLVGNRRKVGAYMCRVVDEGGTYSRTFGDEGTHLGATWRMLRDLQGPDCIALPPGKWRVSISATGCAPETRWITVPEAGSVGRTTFWLSPSDN